MSILDTFYILFKSDTSGLKKGADQAIDIISNLKNFLVSAIPAGLAAFSVKSAVDFGVEISKTSRLLGVNVADLNAWRNAVELAGGDAGQFESTLTSLASKFNASSETILKLLPRYAEILSKLSPQRAQQVGKNILGLDEGTILLLQRGRREVESWLKSQREANVLNKQSAELFLKYDNTLTKVKQSTSLLSTELAISALPYLIKFYDIIDKIVSYLAKHEDFVIGFGIAVAALGLRFALATLPITLMSILIIGLIGLFALVYDDIQAFLKGNKSVIGYLLEHYPKTAQAIHNAFKLMAEGFDILGIAADKLLHPLRTLEEALQKIQDLGDNISGFIGDKLGIDLQSRNHYSIDDKISGILKNSPQLATGGKNTSISIGEITVHTQATDAVGIANTLEGALNSAYSQVANYHADSVVS